MTSRVPLLCLLVFSCGGASDVDAGVVDAGVDVVDAGVVDAGVDVVDAGVVDAGVDVVDAGVVDAGVDAGVVDAGTAGLDWRIVLLDGGAVNVSLSGVVWNGTEFFAVGSNTSTNRAVTAVSADGEHWLFHQLTLPPLFDVRWDGARYVAVGVSMGGVSVWSSLDGVSWTGRALGAVEPNISSVSWDGARFWVGGVWSNNLYTSPDGVDWQARDAGIPVRLTLNDVFRAGQQLVAVGEEGVVLVSGDDGESWSRVTSAGDRSLRAGLFDGVGYIAVGNQIVVSDGGTSWSLVSSPSLPLYGLTASSGAVYAVGTSSTDIVSGVYRSVDHGGAWTEVLRFAEPGTRLARMAASPTKMVAVGGKSVAVSP